MQGRVALITGGTKGIGRAIALSLAKEGVRVYANYSSDKASAEAMLKEIEGFSGSVVRADVSKKDEVEGMFQKVISEAGGLDILINSAGIIKDGLLMLMPDENWHRVIDVNLNGVFYCSRAALRPMIDRRWGRIINIISPSALSGRAGQCNYSASKGGVLSFTKSLARETARFGITVNAVSPGVIETELTKDMPEKIKKEFLDMIPMGRFGSPENVAYAVRFLASESASYITGEIISVDGGLI